MLETMNLPRRSFLRGSAASGCALGVGALPFLGKLPSLSAAEIAPDPGAVRFLPEIEPLVQLIERTPAEDLIGVVAKRVRDGSLRYREVLAALFLAGIRNVQPRPHVGFKFHAVLVVHSAHLASMASPDAERWLPIFWALEEFKRSQGADVREGDWTMAPVDEGRVPPAGRARDAFCKAMDTWDVEAADAASAAVARHLPTHEAFALFARYGARDFRSIGHKAIYVANAFRTLTHIGEQHAEPVLRSLSYALLNHRGEPNPAGAELDADLPGRRNAEALAGFDREWRGGRVDGGATRALLATLRTGGAEEASAHALELLGSGVGAASVFDALHLAAGELLMRQPGIVALHAVTTTNALRYAFDTAADDAARQFALLQNASFLPLFRDAMGGRGEVREARIDRFEAAPETEAKPGPETLEAVLADIGRDRAAAGSRLLGYLERGGDRAAYADAARRLIFLKGTNSHDYKFSSAIFEDDAKLSPEWRARYLAATTYQLRGSSAKDNGLAARAERALG